MEAQSNTPEQEKELLRKILREQGKKGGQTTLRKHGINHFSKMSDKRWAKEKTEK